MAAAVQATATISVDNIDGHSVTIASDGFNSTNLGKRVYINGVGGKYFYRRSSGAQTLTLNKLGIGVYYISVREGDTSSNTLTVRLVELSGGNNAHQIVNEEFSVYEEWYNASVSADGYAAVTRYADDMIVLGGGAMSSGTLGGIAMIVGGVIDAGGNTIEVSACGKNSSYERDIEYIIPAGVWLKFRATPLFTATSKVFIHARILKLDDYKKILK